MAKHVETYWTDDRDKERIDDGYHETVTLTIGDTKYRWDLRRSNAEQMLEDLESWVECAQVTGPPVKKPAIKLAPANGKTLAQNKKEKAKAIREWCKQKGIKCPPRGMVPARIVAEFDETHTHWRNVG